MGIAWNFDLGMDYSLLHDLERTPCVGKGMTPTIYVTSKVIHPKYWKHLKKGAHQSHLGRQKWAGFW